MYTKNNEKKLYAYFLFLIWPFLSILIALYEYRQKWSKNVIWLFVAFFGYTFVISNDTMDANRYRDQFTEVSTTDNGTIFEKNIYAEESANVDILKPLLDKVVSSFTTNYKILFMFYGLIFGYFFSRSLWLLLDRSYYKLTGISILLLLLFFVVNPIWNINGFRFWTAAQIFVYGILLYFLEGKKKGILFVLSSFLVHFSFLLPIGILLIYLLLGNRLTIYFYFFIGSLLVNELNLEMVRNNLAFLPTVYEARVTGYTSEEYKEKVIEKVVQINWYARIKGKALHYPIYIFLIYLFWKARSMVLRKKELYSLFSFVLLFYGVANVISYIPSAGRFMSIGAGLAIAFIFLFLQNFHDTKFNSIIKLSRPALLLFIIVTIRIGFDVIGLTSIFGNPLIALFMENDLPLIDLIK